MKQTNFLNGKIKIFGFLMILAILIGNVNVTAIPKVSVCGCQGANYLFNCSNTVNESCTLNCNLNSSGTCFTIGADNIVIDGKGFLINGSGSGTGISSSGFSNITIKNCDIRWFQTGIYFENSEDNLILNNTLMYNGIISIDNTGIHFNHVNDSSIIGNTVSSNDFGINLDYSSDNNITNNTVNNNGKGIHIFASSGNTVDNNNVSSNNCSGIYVEGMGYASYNNITNNAVFGNGFGSSYSCNYYPYSDRYLCGITFNFEDHSNIINNIVNENHDGICLDNSFDNAMIDNTVNNNQRGIYIMDTQTYVNTTNTINSNIVCFNSLIEDTDIHNQGDSTTGNDNTCNTTYNYNDATQGVTPCTHACGVPICGDETLDAGEECDDGDLTNGDGCDSNCKNETCGNGVK